MTRPGTVAPGGRVLRRATGPIAVPSVCALVFALLVEAAPAVGGDLAAQQWWASWASSNGAPVDLGWYGGVPVASYSLLGPWAGALLGLPLAGVLGTVLGAASTSALLGRLRPDRPAWTIAGVVAAATWAADQWSGRTTFGLGAAVGVLALVVASGPSGLRARVLGCALAAVAGATSPLASAFLLLAAAAWWWGALPVGRPRRWRASPAEPGWLAVGALLPLTAALVLGAVSGPEPFRTHQMLAAVAATGPTWALVPAAYRVLRAGVAMTAGLLLLTWGISDPVGSNSVRLVLIFAAPVLVAAARTEWPATLLGALAVAWLLPPVLMADFVPRDPGPAEAQAAPLLRALAARGPVGRVEVVPMHGHATAPRWPASSRWRGAGCGSSTRRATVCSSTDPSTLPATCAGYGTAACPTSRCPVAGRTGRPEVRRRCCTGVSPASGRCGATGGGGCSRSPTAAPWPAAGRSSRATAPGWSSMCPGQDGSRWRCGGPGGRPSSVPAAASGPGGGDGWTTLGADRPGRYVITSSWRPAGRCG